MADVPAWRQKLQTASFRGVGFGVFEAPSNGGRRTVVHEYPFRDTPYVEDLGRRARSFTFQAFVVGDDYMSQRDALIAALETPGPGTLVHPYRGSLVVQAGEFTCTETATDGGMASFALSFTQSSDVVFPSAVTNAASSAVSNAGVVASAASDMLVSAWKVSGPASIAAAAKVSVLDTVGIVSKGLGPAALLAGQADVLGQKIRAFEGNLAGLVANPTLLGASFAELFGTVLDIPDALQGVASLTRLYGALVDYFASKVRGKSAAAVTAAGNDEALRQSLLFGVVSTASTLAVGADYESLQQAQATAAELDGLFDELVYAVTDDALYAAVVDLQVSVDAAIPPPGQSLPNVVSVPVVMSTPSLALAYAVYGDVDEELDLVARNGVVNPFCVPGGSVVLTLQ